MDDKRLFFSFSSLIEKTEDTLHESAFPSVVNLMLEKMEYHKMQIKKHEKEIEDIEFLLHSYQNKYTLADSFIDYSSALEINLEKKINVQGSSRLRTYYGSGYGISKPVFEGAELWGLNGEKSKRGKSFWKTFSLNVIHDTQKLTRSADILNATGSNMDKEERRIEMIVLSGCLSELCDDGIIQKIDFPGKKGFYYGLPHMFDKTGIPLKKYFNTDEL